MALDIIGPGFGRTGTSSMKIALEHLGLGPAHHMFEVTDHYEQQVPFWEAATRGEAVDWDAVFAGYRSQVDWPGAQFWRELMGHYPDAKVILIGTGSELQWCVKARETLEAEGIPTRVVSMPSWFLFALQSQEYQDSVLPKGTPKVSVEAGSTIAWPRYSDAQVGIDRFGLSAPGDLVMKEFGITAEAVVEKAKGLLKSA